MDTGVIFLPDWPTYTLGIAQNGIEFAAARYIQLKAVPFELLMVVLEFGFNFQSIGETAD